MKKIIKGQTWLLQSPVNITDDLTNAVRVEFWWTKPNGDSGIWNAIPVAQSLERIVLP